MVTNAVSACSVPAASVDADRRGAPRYLPTAPLSCHLTAMIREGQWSAEVRDISVEGVGLLTAKDFERGTILGVHLGNAFGTYLRFIMVQVMHSVAQTDGRFLLGGEFVGRLEEDEMDILLSRRGGKQTPAEKETAPAGDRT